MRKLAVLAAFMILCLKVGQALSQSPAFEVASVKLSADQPTQIGRPRPTGLPPAIPRGKQGAINYTHVTLTGVLSQAYSIMPSEIVGPSWLKEKFYDIVAKMPNDAQAEQVPEMLQNLLALRFRMRVHWDTQQESGYALVTGKNSLKLTRSVSNPDGATQRSDSIGFGGPTGQTRLGFKEITLEDFAKRLTMLIGRPVANMTEIQGAYDITIECASESLVGLPVAFRQTTVPEDSGVGPSIFSAIRELGLDLISRKLAVKRLVVDSAEKIPTEN